MASIDQLLDDIKKAPSGPQITAIFDFDGTLIAGYSATVFIREQLRRGDLSPRDFVELMRAMTSFGLGSLGFSGMMAVNAQFMRGIEEQTYHDVGEALYRKQIARRIHPESRALVDAHVAKGHTVAVISSATPYQVQPAARDLGIDHVMCTRLEVSNGRFTGGVERPTCFGQGKVDAAEALADKIGADLDQSFFYSDSTDDLLLLERIGRPRALNPSDKLERIAQKQGWPVARFVRPFHRRHQQPGDQLRCRAADLCADRVASRVGEFLVLPVCRHGLCADRPEAERERRGEPVVAPACRVRVQSPEQG